MAERAEEGNHCGYVSGTYHKDFTPFQELHLTVGVKLGPS